MDEERIGERTLEDLWGLGRLAEVMSNIGMEAAVSAC